jgi:polyhydroxybutyrate depolymerase
MAGQGVAGATDWGNVMLGLSKYYRLACSLLAMLCLASWGTAARADFHAYENVTAFQQTVSYGGQSRTVLFLKPTVPATQNKVPAMVLLHYLNGNSIDMTTVSNFAKLVRDQGIWVIVPQGINGEWNYKMESGQPDDVGFISQVITNAEAQFPIDPHHVYMGGYSDGGSMSETMACMHPEQFAGGLIVASSMYYQQESFCKPAMGTPMVFFNGSQDTINGYFLGLFHASVPASAKYWATLDGCSGKYKTTNLAKPIDDNTNTHVSVNTYSSCPSGSSVLLYTVWNGGHTWPGAYDVGKSLGTTSQEIDATQVGWQFLTQFSR